MYQDEVPGSTKGKWVRYDENGKMIKGWYAEGTKVYYYDLVTGAMSKGSIFDPVDDSTWYLPYFFDEIDGTARSYEAFSIYCQGAAMLFLDGHEVKTASFMQSGNSFADLGFYTAMNFTLDSSHVNVDEESYNEVKDSDYMIFFDIEDNKTVYKKTGIVETVARLQDVEGWTYDLLDYSHLDQSDMYVCKRTSDIVDGKYSVEAIKFQKCD